MNMSDFRGYGEPICEHRNNMKTFLRKLDLLPSNGVLRIESLETAINAAHANFGAPNSMIVDNNTFKILSQFDGNLK